MTEPTFPSARPAQPQSAWVDAAVNMAFAPAPVPVVPIAGSAAQFPVHRIYCVGRNYAEHAREMGGSDREAPFSLLKPADAVLPG